MKSIGVKTFASFQSQLEKRHKLYLELLYHYLNSHDNKTVDLVQQN